MTGKGSALRLAFFIFRYFPHGGLQRNFLHVASLCRDRGHEVSVYTLDWAGPRPEGIQVNVVKGSAWTNDGQAVQFAKQVPSILKSEKIDVAIGFNKIPGLDVYYSGDPCYVERVNRKYATWYEKLIRLTPRYRNFRKLEESVFQASGTTQILLLTASEEKVFQKHYRTPAHRFHVLPPGLLPDRVPSGDNGNIRILKRKQLGLSEKNFVLLFIAASFRTKGFDRVLRGVASLPKILGKNTRLLAVGDPRVSWFKGLARWLGVYDQIVWLPHRDDISEIMACADALIHPSKVDAGGGVILEAMVAGLPVLTTEVCGYSGYVNQAKAGVVVPAPFQQHQFNQALSNFMMSSKSEEWGENGKKFGGPKKFHQRFQMAVDLLEKTAKEKGC